VSPGADPGIAATLVALRAAAARVDAAARLEPPAGEAILRSVVDAAAALIRAEAASIALYDAATDRLVFRVAAGEHGQGVVGLAIRPGDGVAGYVFASGEPLAIGETTIDPRFQRNAAEQTGYVPRSLLAVPLADDTGTIGVLEVLDRRDGAPFDLADLDAATVFARQATVAIRSTGLERSVAALLRHALLSIRSAGEGIEMPDDAAIEALVAEIAPELDGGAGADGDGPGAWRLADAIASVRTAAPDQLEFVVEILEVLARRSGRPANRYRGVRR
jgi:GAF domain-containing protein